jgi:hypothetical protein
MISVSGFFTHDPVATQILIRLIKAPLLVFQDSSPRLGPLKLGPLKLGPPNSSSLGFNGEWTAL